METTAISLENLVRDQGFASLHEFAKIRLTVWLKRLISESFMPSQETAFQSLLDRLSPEVQKGAYTEKPIMDESDQKIIEETAEKFAKNCLDYVQKEWEMYVFEQVQTCHLLRAYYQKKYQVENYELALNRLDEYNFGIFEKEDDLAHWEQISDELLYFQELTQKISA